MHWRIKKDSQRVDRNENVLHNLVSLLPETKQRTPKGGAGQNKQEEA
jgi:hypothetical protein